MKIKSNYIKPKFKKESNPKVGLLALSTDLTIERDFNSICHKLPLDIFVNRIHNENPLTKENLLKMYDQIETITEKILAWTANYNEYKNDTKSNLLIINEWFLNWFEKTSMNLSIIDNDDDAYVSWLIIDSVKNCFEKFPNIDDFILNLQKLEDIDFDILENIKTKDLLNEEDVNSKELINFFKLKNQKHQTL